VAAFSAAFGAVLAVTGCAKAIDGVAVAPQGISPAATVMLTADGYGIQLGAPAARSAIEIFIEPQCALCARLQMFHGGEIADYIDRGDLVVTYRPVTIFDTAPNGYSHRVSNALFLAAADSGLPAVAFQNFVEQLYWDADPSRDDQYLADIAATARLPQQVIERIAAGAAAVDTAAMDAANQKLLNGIRLPTAVPMVYDLNTHDVVDTADNDWLKRLVGR